MGTVARLEPPMPPHSAPQRKAMDPSHELSGLLRLYRLITPGPIRRMVVAHLSIAARDRLKQYAAFAPSVRRLAGRSRAAWLAHTRSDMVAGPHRSVRLVRGVPKATLVREDLSPLQAREANARSVCQAFDAFGLDYFRVRGNSHTSTVVAVDADHRETALQALAQACRSEPGYVCAPDARWRKRRATSPGFRRGAWRRLARSDVIRTTWYYSDPQGRMTLGPKYGCDVEFWTADETRLLAPRPNRRAVQVPRTDIPVHASDSLFTWMASGARPLPAVRTRKEFARPGPEDIRFPVDVVYTWVDGSDPEWQRRRAACTGQGYHEEAANAARYLDRGELRYSLRSLSQYAPWVRTIYLVTDEQTPSWLDVHATGLRVINHKQIFSDASWLPTFNSHAIESQLHHIDGLSEHFLYLNDDVFLGRPTTPQDFFFANGLTKFFPSTALVAPGPPCHEDAPVAAAGKNVRVLIEVAFGTVISCKMKHTPHALRRDVLYEIEKNFTDAYRSTASHRVRSVDDLAIVSSLYHYYAFHTARAVPGRLRYAYVDLSHPALATRLGALLERRDRQVFCLNDTVSGAGDALTQQSVLSPFLQSYFPVPSPYETTSHTA
ncbi:stealth family protein [Streptomyces atriruber]|uniref:stealth family protein n=1 Tax=Streptomyces atriruber TaxID=545121 RepID=UPI000AB2C04F|nr:stealth family protein [Streptomyces atriruber]